MSALWVFGYGSLVWKPAFPFDERRLGFIAGYARRFWQGSTDHRGVPGAPGRVVTLVADAEATCGGMAYRVRGDARDRVLARLDHREKGGYERHQLEVRDPAGSTFATALTYVATPDNDNFLGPAPLGEIAAQVRRCQGPSGPNDEYVLRLADALLELEVEDAHVAELAALLRKDST